MAEKKDVIEMKRTVKNETEINEMVADCHRNNNSGYRGNSDDFNRLEISDIVIDGKNLRNAEFKFSKLVNVTFLSCDMNSAEFMYAELENVSFKGCQSEDLKFQFAKLKNVKFDECNACGCEFDLTHGNVEFMNCHMERCEFPNAEMDIKMIHCNSEGSEFNGGKFTFETAGSRLARAEFNESELSGTITECVCTNVEVNASVCSDFELKNCKTCGLEHENTIGFRNTEEALDSLLNADDDEELEEDFLTEDESDSNDDGKDSPLPF